MREVCQVCGTVLQRDSCAVFNTCASHSEDPDFESSSEADILM